MATDLYTPIIDAEHFSSEEWIHEAYTKSLGKEPTQQWAVDRFYNNIKYPLFYFIAYIYFKNRYKRDYISISSVTLQKMFGAHYQVIRDLVLEYFDGHVFESREGVESYYADPKTGFCKKYFFNPRMTHRIEKKVAIPVSDIERKKMMKIFHYTDNPKVIEEIEDHQKLIQVDESAPDELKKKVENHQENGLKSKKTDSRFYGLNMLKSHEREHLRAPNNNGEMEEMVEVDYSSFHPRILSKIVYQLPENITLKHLEEQERWKSINEEYGDIYTYIASKSYNREPHEITKKQRKICKNTFVKIMNTNYGTGTVKDDFEWKVATLLHEELRLYTDVLLSIDNIEDIQKLLPKWKYEKFKDGSSLTYRVLSTMEYKIMINVLNRVMNKWEKMGFLWIHDCVMVPQSHVDQVREIMNQEFEKFTI